jgi:16S rRNA (cytidine1402-2'-O)-methyltransferase
LALVSDAGTPGISDPGGKLIEKVIKTLGDQVKIIPIPGPCALICAASISGFPMDKFLFLGFLPKKKKKKKFFEEILQSKYPVIFYESPYRLIKTLEELKNFNQKFKVCVAKELTKKFETIYYGKLEEILDKIKKEKIKGEFVIIVQKINEK